MALSGFKDSIDETKISSEEIHSKRLKDRPFHFPDNSSMKPSLEDEDNDSREQSTARAFETRSSLANAAKQVDRLKISEEKSIFFSKKKDNQILGNKRSMAYLAWSSPDAW